jgi:hypothetical protein
MTQTQALTQALVLAITAPDDQKAQMAIELSQQLAECLNAADVEQCKLDALCILEMS